MKTSPEEFKKLSKEIGNEEVPRLLFTSLLKINDLLTIKEKEDISDSEAWRIGLFKIFLKQYNTILVLSRRVSYIFLPKSNYIDLKSIYTLIRSCHELYLTFRFLSVKSFNNDQDESNFKYLCYQLSGALDNKRTFEKIKDNPEFSEIYNNEIPKINKSINDIKKKNKKNILLWFIKKGC